MLGQTGAGKSSLINAILGSNAFRVGESRESETACMQCVRYANRSQYISIYIYIYLSSDPLRFDLPWGFQLEIIDSPGFEDNRPLAYEVAQQRAIRKLAGVRHIDIIVWVISVAQSRLPAWTKDKKDAYAKFVLSFSLTCPCSNGLFIFCPVG